MRRLAEFDMSNELLCQLLNLPYETVVVNVCDGSIPNTFKVFIEHPSFPERQDNECALKVKPTFERIYSEAVKFIKWDEVADE